jgi:hypothetical protein
MIRHATTAITRPTCLFGVSVIRAPLLRRPVLLASLRLRPFQPLGAAGVTAVRMPVIAAPVSVKRSAAGAADDLVDLRLDLGETKTGLLGNMTR